jgi:EamA domain-containing membrane protein RarD
MITYRYILGFAIFAFLMGVLQLIVAAVLQFSTHHGSGDYTIFALLWCALGLLAGWISQLLKQQADRLDRVESRLREITGD